MLIPKLIPKVDRREYHNCEESIRDNIVYDYLFNGLSHRQLDITYRGCQLEKSRGYESMNILHGFGINGDFKGCFSNAKLDEVISSLELLKDDNYQLIIDTLRRYKENDTIINNEFENSENNEAFYEGSITTFKMNRYERNQKARRECIRVHGYQCKICEFDFEKTYGKIGKGLIHIHHVVPISKIKEEYRIDYEKDLIPVCPNCHMIIHRRKNPYTVEEVKDIIQKNLTSSFNL